MRKSDSTTLEKTGEPFSLTPVQRRVIDTSVDIREALPDHLDFLHTVLCQLGLPRKRTDERVFERKSGNTSLLLKAGELRLRGEWVDQPLPYGTQPRLVLVHVCTQARRTKSRTVEVGHSVRDFLTQLGIQPTGGKRGGYTMFKKQMQALAACRMVLGIDGADKDETIDAKLIRRFEAWLQPDDGQMTMWPGVLELSTEFYESLVEHSIPLDPRALAALKDSSLNLDIYCWLANRLCRIRNQRLFLSWQNLYEQFGQEYTGTRALPNFKRKFLHSLHSVQAVYPDAKMEQRRGGITFYPSPPPIPKTQVVVELPSKGEYIPWKDRTDLLDPKPR